MAMVYSLQTELYIVLPSALTVDYGLIDLCDRWPFVIGGLKSEFTYNNYNNYSFKNTSIANNIVNFITASVGKSVLWSLG